MSITSDLHKIADTSEIQKIAFLSAIMAKIHSAGLKASSTPSAIKTIELYNDLPILYQDPTPVGSKLAFGLKAGFEAKKKLVDIPRLTKKRQDLTRRLSEGHNVKGHIKSLDKRLQKISTSIDEEVFKEAMALSTREFEAARQAIGRGLSQNKMARGVLPFRLSTGEPTAKFSGVMEQKLTPTKESLETVRTFVKDNDLSKTKLVREKAHAGYDDVADKINSKLENAYVSVHELSHASSVKAKGANIGRNTKADHKEVVDSIKEGFLRGNPNQLSKDLGRRLMGTYNSAVKHNDKVLQEEMLANAKAYNTLLKNQGRGVADSSLSTYLMSNLSYARRSKSPVAQDLVEYVDSVPMKTKNKGDRIKVNIPYERKLGL